MTANYWSDPGLSYFVLDKCRNYVFKASLLKKDENEGLNLEVDYIQNLEIFHWKENQRSTVPKKK